MEEKETGIEREMKRTRMLQFITATSVNEYVTYLWHCYWQLRSAALHHCSEQNKRQP